MSELLIRDRLGRPAPAEDAAPTFMNTYFPALPEAPDAISQDPRQTHWLRNTILSVIGAAAVCAATLGAVRLSTPVAVQYVQICPIIGADGLPNLYAEAIISNQSAAIINCAAGAGR